MSGAEIGEPSAARRRRFGVAEAVRADVRCAQERLGGVATMALVGPRTTAERDVAHQALIA